MKDRYYDENNEELSQIVQKESIISKFVKAGIVTTAVYAASGKAKNTKLEKYLSNDLTKYGAIAAGTYALSSDDNIGGDIASASSFIFLASGAKVLQNLNRTTEGFSKVQKTLNKMDTMGQNFNLKVFNFGDKISDTFSESRAKRMKDFYDKKENAGPISEAIEKKNVLLEGAKMIGSMSKIFALSAIDTMVAPFANIKTDGFIEGMKKNFKAIDDTQYMRYYNSMDESEKHLVRNASNISKGFSRTDVFKDDPGFITSGLNSLGGTLGFENMFTKADGASEHYLEALKKIDKIHSIKNSTTFSDVGGLYTKFDDATGKLKLDISKLGSSESSNIDLLNSMYYNFTTDQRQSMGKFVKMNPDTKKPLLSEDGKKIFGFKFDRLSSEEKEGLFVKYLNENGMEEFVKNNYKVDGAVTVKDIDVMFRNKSLETTEQLNKAERMLNAAHKNGVISQEIFDKRMAMVTAKRENFADQDIIDYVQNNLNHSNLKKFIEVDYDSNISKGVKNGDVLGNFTFTNVVKKSDEFGYTDETALDGTVMALKAIGMVEKNFVGFFKTPFTKQLNRWNPLKLVESENRIKELVANEYNPYGVTSNGFISNGKVIQVNSYDKIINEKTKQAHTFFDYYSDGKSSYKRTFTKQNIDMLDDNYEVARENAKRNNSYRDIFNKYKQEGFKSALDEATKSHFNPLPMRYDKGKGFRGVNPNESYFNDQPIWGGAYGKSLFGNNLSDSAILNKMDEKGMETGALRRTANLILGESGDINGRHLNIDNEFISDRYSNMFEYSVTQMIEISKKRLLALSENEQIIKKFNLNDPSLEKRDWEGFYKYSKDNYIPFLRVGDDIYNKETKGVLDSLSEIAKKDEKLNAQFNFIRNNYIDPATISARNLNNALGQSPDFKEFNEFAKKYSKEFDMVYSNTDLRYVSKNGLKFEGDLEIGSKNSNYIHASDIMPDFGRFFSMKTETESVNDGTFYFLMDDNIKALSLYEDKKLLKNYPNEIAQLGIGESEEKLSNVLSHVKKFMQDVDGAKNRAAEDIGKEILRNQIVKNTDVGSKVREMVLHKEFKTDELKDAYNLALGYNLNRVLKDEKNDYIFKYFNDLSEKYSGATLNKDSWELGFAHNLVNTNKTYADGHLSEFKYEMLKKNDNNTFKSFGFFEELDNNAMIEGKPESSSYFKAVDKFREISNVKREHQYGSSMVVEDTIKNIFNIQSAMEATRMFVQSFIDKNKRSWSSYQDVQLKTGEYIEDAMKNRSSLNFGEIDSTFGMFMKRAINQVQGPLEFIGIERITNKALGSHWTDQYKNFMKYRYLPLAGLAAGYLAADSAADAIVPDDVPIFGNGLTGVATRGYATARVGLQYGLKYTGLLSAMRTINDVVPVIDNGLTWFLDPLMDPGEMVDVYFHGKEVRVNKNRNWYTAGRQTGDGEEFGQYRPHLLYTLGNPTAGIYDNKVEKFFRQDMLLTKYPWYILDPYKEERDAYEKFGAAYPKTEQLFKDIPLFGHLLGATLGEMIKPTQYIGEEKWRVGENMMKNPGYNPNDPNSPEYIEFKEPNKFLASFFDAVEDYKTFSGMHGYLFGKMTEAVFGDTSPYTDNVVLDSIDNDINMISRYERLELGGMFGTTEGVRRLLDGDSLGLIEMNPLEQKLPDWMPEFFKKGKNPYMKSNFGEYTLPGEAFERTYNSTGNKDLDQLRVLSTHAPYSKPFTELKGKIFRGFNELSDNEKTNYLESLSYASEYGKREFNDEQSLASEVFKKQITIDKKIAPNEFMSDGVRYKIDNMEDDFNKLSEKIGSDKARKKIDEFNNKLEEGQSYQFLMSGDATYSVGTDNDGDYIKVASPFVDKSIRGNSVYNRSGGLLKTLASPFTTVFNQMRNNAMPSHIEKVFGKKTAYQEWSQETVQAPYFRDWDNTYQSFVEPFFNYSSNSIASSLFLGNYVGDSFINSNATFDGLGTLVMAGRANLIKNIFTGDVTRSSQYEDEANVHKELEKIKAISGDKSYYNLNGQENLMQLKNMVNENDSVFLEGLINTTSSSERNKILNTADDITANVLKTVWNRHQKLIGNENSDKIYEIEKEEIDQVIDIGAYTGDADQARLALKSALNVDKSKLDNKRIGVISSYRGGMSQAEASLIKQKMYKGYNSKSVITSTIYPKGTINFNRREN